ncbi:uncharacterized protein TM35_000341730 [Trypanosoma theileri]|uniref:Uncharacterized protein n=1 Tax=Trypanosoma theileri TaxID=67003 RepID=A0A1X0NLZ0_9TRYP|nr:uncharacterized protein TM35_000341730 [Trypanosoma theileri]ORC85561.1 hypothetical protein TM35_000341730 [Trypanosoma theileri]
MIFRSRKYSLSPNDVGSPSSYSKVRRERPSSAPSTGSSGNYNNSYDIPRVEQRLRIVKRSRARQTPDMSYIPSNNSPSPSPSLVSSLGAVPMPPAVDPPCVAYPMFDLSRLPQHEQNTIEALVTEITDAIAFPDARQR